MTSTTTALPTSTQTALPTSTQTAPPQRLRREVLGFLASGVLAFGVQLGLFNLLLRDVGPLAANGVALLVATAVAFYANRYIGFAHRVTAQPVREVVAFIVVNLIAIGITELGVAVGSMAGAARSGLLINLVTVAATAVGTVFRFFAYRRVVFTG